MAFLRAQVSHRQASPCTVCRAARQGKGRAPLFSYSKRRVAAMVSRYLAVVVVVVVLVEAVVVVALVVVVVVASAT